MLFTSSSLHLLLLLPLTLWWMINHSHLTLIYNKQGGFTFNKCGYGKLYGGVCPRSMKGIHWCLPLPTSYSWVESLYLTAQIHILHVFGCRSKCKEGCGRIKLFKG